MKGIFLPGRSQQAGAWGGGFGVPGGMANRVNRQPFDFRWQFLGKQAFGF